MTALQRRDQRRLVALGAAAGIDEGAAPAHRGKEGLIVESDRLRRQRQEPDDDVDARQKVAERCPACMDGDAVGGAGSPGPAVDVEPVTGQHRGDRSAERAEPQHTDAAASRGYAREFAPETFGLLGAIAVEAAMIVQHPVEHIFAHALDLPRLDQPQDRDAGGNGVDALHLVHAGADQLDQLEIAVARKVRRAQDEKDVDLGGIAGIWPDPEIEFAEFGAQRIAPFARVCRVALEDEAQGL